MPDLSTRHEAEVAVSPKFITQQLIWSTPVERRHGLDSPQIRAYLQTFRAALLAGEQSRGGTRGVLHISATQEMTYLTLEELQVAAGSARILEVIQLVSKGDQTMSIVVERDIKGCWIIWGIPHHGSSAASSAEEKRKALTGLCVEPDFLSEATLLSEAGEVLSEAASALKNLVVQSIW
eukprot:6327116-Prymnesium_polylepis.1